MGSSESIVEVRDVEPGSRIGLFALLRLLLRSSRSLYPDATAIARWRAAKLFVQQLAHLRRLRDWHGGASTALREALARRPSLAAAAGRPYMSNRWNASDRLCAIEQHYRQLSASFRALRLSPDAQLRLGHALSRSGPVEIVLDSPVWFAHEGELSINLFVEGERLYSLVFSFGFDAGMPVALVGALQGLGSEEALDRYRQLTRACHGLRPRDLLLAAFRSVCLHAGVRRILGIDDLHRVSRNPYFGGAANTSASYDAVWAEHGGTPRKDGFHEIPVVLPRRTHDAIPARKRSEYRQRYAMLDAMAVEIAASLNARGLPEGHGPKG